MTGRVAAGVTIVLALSSGLLAQPVYQRTAVVDPTAGAGNYQTIADAIHAITPAANEHWTLRIHSGTYTSPLTLGGTKERIDLEGVDRDSVIIQVTGSDAVVIESGDELSRMNALRNLTIKTLVPGGGHGIRINQGTSVPKDIVIENVTVDVRGPGKLGITGGADGTTQPATHVQVINSSITAANGDGVRIGDDWLLQGTSIDALKQGAIWVGIRLDGKNGARIVNCQSAGESAGLVVNNSDNLQARGCKFRGGDQGVSITGDTQDALFANCLVFGDGSIHSPATRLTGLITDVSTNLTADFRDCRIQAVGSSDEVQGILFNDAMLVRVLDCDIMAVNQDGNGGGAVGVDQRILADPLNPPKIAMLIGGSIVTAAASEREAVVYDILVPDRTNQEPPRMSRTRMSKWFGPIKIAGQAQLETQRTLNASPKSDTAIYAQFDWNAGDCKTNGIADPDVYRVLSVTHIDGAIGDVDIIGTNWAGEVICDRITMATRVTRSGLRAFKTVTKICAPPAPGGASGTFSVGTSNELGLYYPISADTDVLQQGRQPSGGMSYAIEAIGTVHPKRATVEVIDITPGDSFEWVYLATK